MEEKTFWTSTLTALLTIGATITEGAFVLAGTALILKDFKIVGVACPLISLASAAFAIAIEGQVYNENNIDGCNYLLANDGLRHKIIRDIIIDAHNASLNQTNLFMQYREALENLRKKLKNHGNRTTYKQEIVALKKKLFDSESQAIAYIENSTGTVFSEAEHTLLLQKRNYFFAVCDRKRTYAWIANTFNLISTVGAFYSAFYVSQLAAHQIFFFLGLSFSVPVIAIAAIAALATISYAFLTYRTCMQIIYNDFFSEYWNRLKTQFNQGSTTNKVCIIVGSILFISLMVGLTLATAGTWWKTGIAGQLLLINLTHAVVKGTTMIFIACYTLMTLLFNVKNIIETISELVDIDIRAFKLLMSIVFKINFVRPFEDFFYAENSKVISLPRILLNFIPYVWHVSLNICFLLWQIISFVGHCLSEGVKTDNAFLLPHLFSTLIGSLSEWGIDLHYILKKPEVVDNKKTEILLPIEKNETGDHHHANIPSQFLCGILIVPLLIDWALYKLASGKSVIESKRLTLQRHWGSDDPHPSKQTQKSPFQLLLKENPLGVSLESATIENKSSNGKNGFHYPFWKNGKQPPKGLTTALANSY